MKLLSCAFLLVASMAFVLLGCSEPLSPLPVTNHPDASAIVSGVAAPTLDKGAGVKHSAAGSAQMFIWEGPENSEMPLRSHSNFNAKESMDGSCSGTFTLLEPNGAMKAHARIVGLKVDGSKAKLEYLFITGPYTGRYAFTVVIDNGEGAKASASDMITITAIYEGEPYPTLEDWRAMSPDEFIAFLQAVQEYIPVYVVQEVDGGNIQVR
jgi:hypothetical protein